MSNLSAATIERLQALNAKHNPPPGRRTWGADGEHCNECCNGDRCDDRTHWDRRNCPHCLGTGYALWNPKFQPATEPTP